MSISGGERSLSDEKDREFQSYRRFCEYSVLENKIVFYATLKAINYFNAFEAEELIPQSDYIDVNVIAQRILKLFAKHLKSLICDSMYTNDDEAVWRAIERILRLEDGPAAFWVSFKTLDRPQTHKDFLLFLCNICLSEPSETFLDTLDISMKHSMYFLLEDDNFSNLLNELTFAKDSKTKEDDVYINSGVLRDRFVMMLFVGFVNSLDFLELLQPIKDKVTAIK